MPYMFHPIFGCVVVSCSRSVGSGLNLAVISCRSGVLGQNPHSERHILKSSKQGDCISDFRKTEKNVEFIYLENRIEHKADLVSEH